MTLFDTTPSADRPRTYSGAYMAAGRDAEEKVLAWLRRQRWIAEVVDLRSYTDMQRLDVDCSLALTDGRNGFAEIKSDRHLKENGTGNFLFEILRINHECPADRFCTLGWGARSAATWLLLYSPQEETIHYISTFDYRTAFQNYTRQARAKTKIRYIPTDEDKSTIAILIPDEFVKPMPSYKCFDLFDDEPVHDDEFTQWSGLES